MDPPRSNPCCSTVNGKKYHAHELEELIFVKMSTLPKSIYSFTEIPIKIPIAILRKKNEAGGVTLTDFKL